MVTSAEAPINSAHTVRHRVSCDDKLVALANNRLKPEADGADNSRLKKSPSLPTPS